MKRFLKMQVIAALFVAFGCASMDSQTIAKSNGGSGGALPETGLGAYTRAHAMNPSPPDRIGGPVNIKVSLRDGSTRWDLPGPRQMDPNVFGTPANPLGWEKTPFPLVGIVPGMRQQMGGAYTIVDHATPFSDWLPVGVGSLEMDLTDATAIDGAKTKDKVHFEARFQAPDKSHDYRVVADMPLPHGKFFPTFGGVVTDHLLHGGTGLGTRLMPTEYTYVAFWAKGKVYVDGRLTNDNHLIHVMITEGVRNKGKLQFDTGVRGTGRVLHLMVPPYRIGPKGPEKAPLKTGYIPFPEIKKRMMQAKAMVMKMPPGEKKKKMMAHMEATKMLMMKTKKHVQEAMAAGKMFGQPFLHVMFGNPEIQVSHP
ncbi:MAG: hypothetical protein ACE5E9_14490 [Nitrospinaceae bacterium]